MTGGTPFWQAPQDQFIPPPRPPRPFSTVVGLHAQAHVDAIGHHVGRDQIQRDVEDTGEAVEQHVAHLTAMEFDVPKFPVILKKMDDISRISHFPGVRRAIV